MSSEEDQKSSQEKLRPFRGHSGYALAGVVMGELYVAASRAIVVYGADMNADRFASMAKKIYLEADQDAESRSRGPETDVKNL